VADPFPPIYPLRGLAGAVPPAPDWFARALAKSCDAFTVRVDGATLDCRAWGPRGLPGLVLLHGNSAHMGWWDFLAPFFAGEFRVVTLSFGGMGRSDRRPRYSYDTYVAEALAAAEAGGAYLAGLPVFVGHSMGGNPVTRIAARQPHRLRGAVTLDTGRLTPSVAPSTAPARQHRVYPSLAEALDRFRLAPSQPCDNLYLVDHVARLGLGEVPGGYSWRFDPTLADRIVRGDMWGDLAAVKVPFAQLRGELTDVACGEIWDRALAVAPRGTPAITIAGAYHHVMLDQPLALVAALRTLLAAWA